MADTVQMHPWFRLPTLKRKSAYIYDDSDSRLALAYPRQPSDYDGPQLADPPSKRRRCDVLERGLAQLSIAHPAPGASPIPTWAEATPSPSPVSVERPPIVTEPEPEDVPIECDDEEPRSWFEPEKDRIVITRLDEDEDDEPTHTSVSIPPASTTTTTPNPDPVSVTISPALLDRLRVKSRAQSQHQTFGIPGLLQGPPPKPPLLDTAADDHQKALVLFKPLAISPEPRAAQEEEQELKVVTTTKSERTLINGVSPASQAASEDADMMDVEML
ncbi:hypothetical protein EIP91_011420 [Steccherinum ochraceum]|uniref:Uncharacterized protein n=1 Tax=Steccherinum ochraceum TaxID=92696 RepID=A0A4R0R1U0_9APHY|nr:hypothetical protein EIP91_011420 [Steccherinum ochraceum]